MVNALAEMTREFKKTRAETQEMVSACFQQAIRQVGEAEARRYWHEAAKRTGIKPNGTTNKTRDDWLLSLFDDWVLRHPDNKSRKAAPGLIGHYVADIFPKRYPGHAASITTQVRRLLSQRKLQPPGTRNALKAILESGKLPVLDLLSWDTDK